MRALAERCGEYLELHYGAPADPQHLVRELLWELPPGKALDDKFSLGLFEQGEQLVGGLDVIQDYPEPREWYLGLLVLAPEQRGQGRGAAVLQALVEWLRVRGARGVRLAVSEHNAPGLRFWTRAGFRPLRQVMAEFGHKRSLFHVVRLPLERACLAVP